MFFEKFDGGLVELSREKSGKNSGIFSPIQVAFFYQKGPNFRFLDGINKC